VAGPPSNFRRTATIGNSFHRSPFWVAGTVLGSVQLLGVLYRVAQWLRQSFLASLDSLPYYRLRACQRPIWRAVTTTGRVTPDFGAAKDTSGSDLLLAIGHRAVRRAPRSGASTRPLLGRPTR
jgi:hypothetical protein